MNFNTPQEPQEPSIYFALAVLLALVLLCLWPNLLRGGLKILEVRAKSQQQYKVLK